MSRILNIKQPQQKLSYSAKGKKWRKSNIDFADKFSFYNNSKVRKSLSNKVINLNLYNGKVDVRDLTELVNPHQLEASFIPDNIPHHPIIVPKIDLLLGEEIKRRFDWRLMVTNSNAITKKEEDKKALLFSRLQEMLEANYKDEELQVKIQELQDYMTYDWQDLKEKLGTQILKHYWEEQNFASKFNEGFKNALIMAEEIYQTEIIQNEPVLELINPLKVRTVRSGGSNRIEDSSIIIIEDHWAPGKIVDYFHDELKPKDISYIMDYEKNSSTGGNYSDDDNNHNLIHNSLGEDGEPFIDSLFDIAEINGHQFNSNYTDEEGNIRVFRVYWRSVKEIKKVKYYDEEGNVEYKIRSEEYEVNKDLGEEATSMWVGEWWEGTKIGKDIYIKMVPRKVQYNRLNNPSECHPGIIGQIYNTNQGRAVSLVDRCKNYQYMYNVIWDRLNKAIATNYGKIFELDLSKVPDNWEIEKWLHYAIVNKIAVIDSFKEGSHGASIGKLAGGMNTQGGRAIDMETGAYIQQHIQLLEFIKMEMSEIAGVTKQREGAIHQNETASGVERSVNQSSHITEYWFQTHTEVKLRVLNAFLETAKVALRGNNKKVQYILDDQTIQILNLDSEALQDVDYGVVATNSTKGTELEQFIKSSAQQFMQSGGGLSTIMDIYFSPSLSDMRRKIEMAENKINERNSKAQEDANKLAQQAQQDAKELELAKLQGEDTRNIRDNETKLLIKQMDLANQDVENSDGIIDPVAQEKLDIDREKLKHQKLKDIRQLDDTMKMHKDDLKLKEKQIAKQNQNKTIQK